MSEITLSEAEKARRFYEQNAAIGHIAVLWNMIEAQVEWASFDALSLPYDMVYEVTSRMGSYDSITDVIRIALRGTLQVPDARRVLVDEALGRIKEAKIHRNNIVHSRPTNVELALAQTIKPQGRVVDVSLSRETLSIVMNHLNIAFDDSSAIKDLVSLYKQKGPAVRRGLIAIATNDPEAFEREALAYDAKFLSHRKRKQALPSLPMVPDQRRQWLANALAPLKIGPKTNPPLPSGTDSPTADGQPPRS